MGIPGLTSFVDKDSDNLLVCYRLQDTNLVIDGHCLLWVFLEKMMEVDPMEHGGEYAQLRTLVQQFFRFLRECECQPFVVFDGASDLDGKKMETRHKRFVNSIRRANAVTAEGKSNTCGLQLDRFSMIQVLREMKVDFVFSQFEADREIAILANHWGCPVLGKDSDYFIMDISGGYIPLTTLKWDKARRSQNGFYLPGKLYKLDKFCDVFEIRKELIPLFGTLCCNDYVNFGHMQDFLKTHVYSRSDYAGYRRHDDLRNILKWVSRQTSLQEGLDEVLGHLPAEGKGPLRNSIGVYDISNETSSLLSSFFEVSEKEDLERSPLCADLGAPLWVAMAHQRGDIMSECIDIMGHKSCITCVQVENPRSPSAWLPSERLFSIFAGIILAENIRKAGPGIDIRCTVHIRDGDNVEAKELAPTRSIDQYGQLPSLTEIPTLTQARKHQLILSIFAPTLNADADLDSFPAEFQLALLATVYWINATETRFSRNHLTSLFLGWVHLYTEKHVRSGRQSTKIREIEEEAKRTLREETPDPDLSQVFAEWQYAFLYAVHINKLLQCPLPDCPAVSLLFSGLLMHGLVNELRGHGGEITRDLRTLDHVDVVVESFLAECSERVKQLFKSICTNLSC